MAEIELGEATAIVGQNGAGKTSILRALNAFFNFEEERADFEAGRHSYGGTHQTIIQVDIVGLADDPALPRLDATGTVRARLKYRRDARWECQVGPLWQPIHPQVLREALRKQISYAFVPTQRDHSVAHDPAHGLLERVVGEWITHNRQRDRISPEVELLGRKLVANSLSGLERKLQKIAPLNGPFSFELRHSSVPDYKLLLANLVLSVKEGGQSIPLSDSGSGTQSMAVFALYAYLAEIESKAFILGVEEPEQNLHPQAQQQLTKSLIGLGLQVLFTTHSPTVVDALDHEQVVLCRRIRGKKRALEIQVTQVEKAFFSDHSLDKDKYYKFHRRRNSEFMFADFVIVTESPIDSVLLATLLEESGFDLVANGVNIVAVDGVNSLPYMYHILLELGIACAFVVDKDYFLPYRGPTRESSLDTRGYPQYASVAKSGTLLNTLFPDATQRSTIVKYLIQDADAARRELLKVGFFCFNYAIEVDLVGAKVPRERFHDFLGTPVANRTEFGLLGDKSQWKKLKNQEAMLTAISGLPPMNMPLSYLNIRREIPKLVAAARPTV
ncbi:hypothetical protein AS189_09570 [Arthrobacter alpinus]|uniref:ATP-dependent endonuclease n=1 Tax=Arthrobacter alpinus TaxID=656366 RepID=A0A0S2LZ85_9MICC|nr:hypothetical protein AS189_09570 [Arthrobacter alpinus]